MSQTQGQTANTDYFHQFLNRTMLMLGQEAVDTLRTKTVAVAGCGGQGGSACLTLARMGVGGFILADPKPFDEPDINRQWAANLTTLGRNKAEVYEELLRQINPDIRVRTHTEGITDTNVEQFLAGADILIDCLDVAVAPALRAKLFAGARTAGIYAATGAMISFGGVMAVAAPDGLPMDLINGHEDEAIRDSRLPRFLDEIFVPEFVRRVERTIGQFKAPSISVSPALLGLMLSTEAVVALLGASMPGWRAPVCLPNLLVVDLLRMTYRVARLEEFMEERGHSTFCSPNSDTSTGNPSASQAHNDQRSPQKVECPLSSPDAQAARRAVLSKVGWNTNLLPHEAVQVDLLTDSWSEIPGAQTDDEIGHAAPVQTEDVLRGLLGYRFFVPVFRGRFAESLLARTIRPGGIVVCNSLFPTTRFHLQSGGLDVRELPCAHAYDAGGDAPFKGDLDTAALGELLFGPEGQKVRAVYMELAVNATGGHPVSAANLRAVRELTAQRGIPVLLDTTRAFENAELVRQREPGYAERSLGSIVRELCSYSDACAGSLTKDFRCRVGGYVGTNHMEMFVGVRDLTLAMGDGLDAAGFAAMRAAAARHAEWTAQSQARVAQTAALHKELAARGVPVLNPPGGHGLFIDVRAMLPHVASDQFPAQALANELFTAAGVRGSDNLITPVQAANGACLLRLALPLGGLAPQAARAVVEGLSSLFDRRQTIRGLRRTGGPPGVLGQFAGTFTPISGSR